MPSGPVYPPSAFTQAYRAYTPEHGADPLQSAQKADEVQAQTVGFKSALFATDTVTISTAAAQLLAEEIRRRHSVQETSRTTSEEAAASATAAPLEGAESLPEQVASAAFPEVSSEPDEAP